MVLSLTMCFKCMIYQAGAGMRWFGLVHSQIWVSSGCILNSILCKSFNTLSQWPGRLVRDQYLSMSTWIYLWACCVGLSLNLYYNLYRYPIVVLSILSTFCRYKEAYIVEYCCDLRAPFRALGIQQLHHQALGRCYFSAIAEYLHGENRTCVKLAMEACREQGDETSELLF